MEAGAGGRFSTVQSIVGLIAGLVSICGAAYSAVGTMWSAPAPGEIVATVRAAATNRPLPGTVVEVATREDALVTTMVPSDDGLARRTLSPGTYRVRARNPAFNEAVHEVQVVSNGTADVHFMLESRGRTDQAQTPTAQRQATSRTRSSPVDVATREIDRAANKGRRLLFRFGF